ncbi:MAG: hypothetical protein U9N40_00625 [Euryarchaeota archaeon]|nr:hypothetical protein [Euryarchaeota archaeon]
MNTAAIPIPSTTDRPAIAAVLFTINEAIEKTRALITKLRQVKAGLMQNLLTGRVRVPIERGWARVA